MTTAHLAGMEPSPALVRTAGALQIEVRDRGVVATPDLGTGQQRHLFTLYLTDKAHPDRAPVEEPALYTVERPPWTLHEVLASMLTLLQHTGEIYVLAQLDSRWVTDELSVFSGWVPESCAENRAPLSALARETENDVALIRRARDAARRERPLDPRPTSEPDAPTV